MSISIGGRSALILTALVYFAAPSQAAPGADDTAAAERADAAPAPVTLHKQASHNSRRLKKHAGRSSGKIVVKSDADRNANAAGQGDRSSTIPASIANANAQWQYGQYAETPTGNAAKAMSARAASILMAGAQPQPDTQVVSADQLNDVDRALHPSSPPASNPPTATLSMAAADVAAPPASSPALSEGGSAWDQTSLIGKIFIGFGALLTMASAARMFMG
jgi:hypothetical protein